MNKMLVAAISLTAAATLTACGSSNSGNAAAKSPSTGTSSSPSSAPAAGGSDAATVKAAIKAQILSENAASAGIFKMNDAQASCTANAAVDSLGVSKLRSYGLITADNKIGSVKLGSAKLSVADATAVVNAIFSCVGNATLTQAMTTEMDASLPSTLTATQKACIHSKLTIAAIKQLAIASLSGQTGAVTQFEASFAACMR